MISLQLNLVKHEPEHQTVSGFC